MKKDWQRSAEVEEGLCSLTELLTEQQEEEMKANLTVRKFKKNEAIYREGDVPQMLMCLINGKVKIYKDGVGGRMQIIQAVKPHDLFGYRAFFANQNYITTASAIETTIIAMIPMAIIDKWTNENCKLASFFVRRMALEWGNAQELTVNLTQKHIRGRLAEAILFLKENYGLAEDEYEDEECVENGETLSIHLSREDIASLSNMTTSNAIRTLSAFANEGLISLDRRKITILDEESLRRISKIG